MSSMRMSTCLQGCLSNDTAAVGLSDVVPHGVGSTTSTRMHYWMVKGPAHLLKKRSPHLLLFYPLYNVFPCI